jgi:hypothetical protein
MMQQQQQQQQQQQSVKIYLYWLLALAVTKNVRKNMFRTVTIELLSTRAAPIT